MYAGIAAGCVFVLGAAAFGLRRRAASSYATKLGGKKKAAKDDFFAGGAGGDVLAVHAGGSYEYKPAKPMAHAPHDNL